MKTIELKDLTLREKIGQTCIFRQYILRQLDDVKEYFKENPIGASWVMGHSASLYEKTETLLENPDLKGKYRDEFNINYINLVNSLIKVPFIPVMDASRGIPDDKFNGHHEMSQALSLGVTNDPDLAYRYGKCLGDDLYSIGYRWVWSPVADNAGVYRDPRDLGANTENNCKLLTAFINGLHDAGVATGAKHFPGADPYEYRDSHFCTSSYAQSKEYWENTQKKEFEACIKAGTDSIMLSHKTFAAVDDTRVNGSLLPATLSYKIITELLKGEMGFEGVVLTDDISMKALTAIYPEEQLYVELLRAGNDMILGPTRKDYIDIIEKAVLNGELPESRIDDACRRVLKMKEKYGIFDLKNVQYPTEERREEIRQNIADLTREISEKAITLVANRTNFLPLNKDKIRKVKIAYIGYSDVCFENLKYAVEEFKKYGAECDVQNGFLEKDNEGLENYDLIIYATYIGFFAPMGGQFFFGNECRMMRNVMTKCHEKSLGVSFGNPDIFFNYFTAAHTFINAYSENRETMESFVKGLYGDVKFTDYAPFPLNPITRTNDVY